MDDSDVASVDALRRPEIPGYRLGEPIGRGTFSVVYSGQRAGSRQQVAVKVLRVGDDPGLRRRFNREIEIMGRLAAHRYVVTILDWGEVDGQPWLAMERLSTSLATQEGHPRRVTPQRVADVGVQVACALATMHGAGLVHRDVKPSNLLEGPDGVIKLADFGIAKGAVGRSRFDTVGPVGTEAYMAPEVLYGVRSPDDRSDQYGLCATLVSLLLGRPSGAELQGCDLESLRRRGAPSGCDDLLEVLARGLRGEPEERYGLVDDVALALDAIRRDHGWQGERYVAPIDLADVAGPSTADALLPPLRSTATAPPVTVPPGAAPPIAAASPSPPRGGQGDRGAVSRRPRWPARRSTWAAVGVSGMVVVGAVAWTANSRTTGSERVDGPADVGAPSVPAAEDGPRPTGVVATATDSAIQVAWDYPDDTANGFSVYVNGARQPEQLRGDTRSTTLSGFIGERELCVEVEAIAATTTSGRSQPSCVRVRFRPSLPPEGTPPADRIVAEEGIRQAMSLAYDGHRARTALDDSTGVDAAIDRLSADPTSGRIAESATTDIQEIVFTTPTEAWFRYVITASTATVPGRFGYAHLDTDSGWKISRATLCQDLTLLPNGACVPDVVPVRPPEPPAGLLTPVTSLPTIVNAIGGLLEIDPLLPDQPAYSPIVTFDFTDRECDVQFWVSGLDTTRAANPIDGPCVGGRGTVQVPHLCEVAGRSTQYLSLRDRAGNVGPEYAYEYECRYVA